MKAKTVNAMSVLKDIINNKVWQNHKGQLFYFIRRVKREQIQVIAGYLSYVCLMSLVPLIVVMLSVLTAFPIFVELQESIEAFVYEHFVPAAGDLVKAYITIFVENASKMSAVAISFLFVVALLLISSIDKTFNHIWRVSKKRRTVTSFALYWMVLTLGPIFVGASIALSTHIISIVSGDGPDVFILFELIIRLLPLLASISAFLILYMAVPNVAVPFKFAISGAVVAAILFELAKRAFAAYLAAFPSYQVIYGALATIPIIFLWVYVSWFVVLIGALVTVSIQEYQQIHAPNKKSQAAESDKDSSVVTINESEPAAIGTDIAEVNKDQ